jgi:hypothetical protein
VLLIDSDQTSNYNGLQVTVASRPWHHINFNGFYTLSKTMSSAQLQNNTTQGLAQNYSNLSEEYGRADTDQRHVFNLSLNWDIDYVQGGNGIVRNLLNGWTISPIIKLRSGLPFTVTNGSVDANLDGNTNDRAQLIGDPTIANPSAALWFNTAAFTQNRAVTGVATDGNSARNMLNGPAYHSVDLALSRDFRLQNRARLTFRAEATNVFNMVSLGQPGSVVPAAGTTSATFGVIRTAYSMRKVQFGLRLTF